MITAITHKNWIPEELGASHNLGLDLPDTTTYTPGVDGIWCPAHYASLLWMSGSQWHFDDNPPWWELPRHILQRDVSYHYAPPQITEPTFVKLAKHKYEEFPAKIYTPEELDTQLALLPHSQHHEYITSTPMNYTEEYRILIINGEAIEGSCYHGTRWWNGEPIRDTPTDILRYAQWVAEGLWRDTAYVIDIGKSDDVLSVVETNPVWCAGFYEIDREQLCRAIIISQQGQNPDYRFIPDTGTQERLKNSRLLRTI